MISSILWLVKGSLALFHGSDFLWIARIEGNTTWGDRNDKTEKLDLAKERVAERILIQRNHTPVEETLQ